MMTYMLWKQQIYSNTILTVLDWRASSVDWNSPLTTPASVTFLKVIVKGPSSLSSMLFCCCGIRDLSSVPRTSLIAFLRVTTVAAAPLTSEREDAGLPSTKVASGVAAMGGSGSAIVGSKVSSRLESLERSCFVTNEGAVELLVKSPKSSSSVLSLLTYGDLKT